MDFVGTKANPYVTVGKVDTKVRSVINICLKGIAILDRTVNFVGLHFWL